MWALQQRLCWFLNIVFKVHNRICSWIRDVENEKDKRISFKDQKWGAKL